MSNNLAQIINTYTEAVQTVDPMKATGKPHSLWVSFAKFYEENEQLDDVSQLFLQKFQKLCNLMHLSHAMSNYDFVNQARTIFDKATKVNFKQVDDLAAVWCEYGEMELRHENYEQALRILRVRRTSTHKYTSALTA